MSDVEEPEDDHTFPEYRTHVDNYRESLKQEIYNVISWHRGEFEPDRTMELGVLEDIKHEIFQERYCEEWIIEEIDLEEDNEF